MVLIYQQMEQNQNHSNLMKIDGVNYKLPNFLVQDTEYKKITDSDIRTGLTLTRNIYMNKFFLLII